MLVSGDLGFSSLVLLVCFVLPLIGLSIRRKWRLTVARKEEVEKLLIMAAEEAARVELEASAGYGGVVSVSGQSAVYHCAVCYSATTTRCARCKVVRYCSGKCQIIHWRRGHKDECHPFTAYSPANDDGRDSFDKAAELEQRKIYGDRLETEGRWLEEPVEAAYRESVLYDSLSSPDLSHRSIDDEIKVEFHSDKEGANCIAESSENAFSGFSASFTRSRSSDGVSLCESISSYESTRSDKLLTAGIPQDMLQTAFDVNGLASTKQLSPKFTHLVESVDKFSNGDVWGSGRGKGSVGDGPLLSSVVLEKNHKSITDAYNNSYLSKSSMTRNSHLSESEASPRLTLNLSGCTSHLGGPGSKLKTAVSNDALPDAPGCTKHTVGGASSGTYEEGSPNIENLPSCDRSTLKAEDSMSGHSHVSRPKEVRPSLLSSESTSSADEPCSFKGISTGSSAFHIRSPSSSRSEENNKVDDNGTASHLLKSGNGLNHRLNSSSGKHATSNVKSNKIAGIDTGATISSQITSFPNGKNGLRTSVLKVVDQLKGSKMLKHHPVGVGSEIIGRYQDDKTLFIYESFVKLYSWNKMELQPSGLLNCGNSCYANAVLQCLAFTPPLTAYFLQKLHSKACTKEVRCFTCEFENLVLKMKEGKSPLSPSGMLSHLQSIGSQLGNGREEDAHEFLRYTIDTMQSVCLTDAGVNAPVSLEREETTLIGLTFGGYLRSQIKCMKCQGKSEQHERMMDLAVEIDGNIRTLEEALRRFTSTEILAGENKYQCSRCKSYEKAKKKLTILEAPNVLTIALKRFQSGKFGKLNKPIQFPEILDLAPYMSGTSDKSPIYSLYGVVVHLDVMNASFSGHYVSYIKNIQNKWFKTDDSVVMATELERVLTKGAYMLLYARCSPRAPRVVRNRTVVADPKNKAIPSRDMGKKSTSSANPNDLQLGSSPDPLDGSANIENLYSRFNRLRSIVVEESSSSSDSSSLISSNSDESSCSTDSTMTKDSSSIDDFYDLTENGWNSPWRNSSNNDPDRYTSGLARTSGSDKGNDILRHANKSKQCRKLTSSSSSSSCRETDPDRLGCGANTWKDVKHVMSIRKR